MNANRDNEEHEWPCTECVSVSACVSDEVVAAAQFDGLIDYLQLKAAQKRYKHILQSEMLSRRIVPANESTHSPRLVSEVHEQLRV